MEDRLGHSMTFERTTGTSPRMGLCAITPAAKEGRERGGSSAIPRGRRSPGTSR
jgi:hypothetical protein